MHRVSWICPRLGQSEVVGAGHRRCVAGDERRCRRRHLLHLPVRGVWWWCRGRFWSIAMSPGVLCSRAHFFRHASDSHTASAPKVVIQGRKRARGSHFDPFEDTERGSQRTASLDQGHEGCGPRAGSSPVRGNGGPLALRCTKKGGTTPGE